VPHRTVRYLHEKEMLVDNRLIVFSANFTPTELGRNDNHSYEIQNPADVEAAEAAFSSQWQEDESSSAAGEESWTASDQVVPADLIPLLGRARLNPLQAKALPVVFGSDVGLVVSAPTSSGKTLIGAAAVLKAIRLQRRKAVYITPSRALTRELHGDFDRWREAGIRVALLSGDVDTDMTALARSDLWVSTTEKFESAFRRSSLAEAIADVGCVVVDEVHFLGDPNRGPLLEALLARLRLLSSRTRLVGLSATVANDRQVAGWLNAQLVRSARRPTQLTIQVLGYPAQPRWVDDEKAKDVLTRRIVSDIIEAGGSVAVFCGSKPKARRVAADLASLQDTGDDEHVAAAALASGVGLHYRGLSSLKKTEALFRNRDIGILVATSGVAQGVNLPARAVIMRDTTLGTSPLSTGDARQMAGRAGRAGQEEAGYAFLLCPTDAVTKWRSRLVEGHAVHSHLADGLVDHVLAEVLLGRIRSAQTLREWFAGSFAVHEGGVRHGDAGRHLDDAVDVLVGAGFVAVGEDGDTLCCTELGSVTSRFLMDVQSAARLLSLLPGPDPGGAEEAERRLLSSVAVAARPLRSAYVPPSAVAAARTELPLAWAAALGPDAEPGSIKTLLAAHLALEEPGRLSSPGRVAGISTGELGDLADDLARHLGWLGALGTATQLSWVPAVANDLSGRIRWRAVRPPRGSGRILRSLERRIPADRRARELPRRFVLALETPDDRPRMVSSSTRQPAPPVNLHIAAALSDEDLQVDVRVDEPACLPLRLTAVARTATASSTAQADEWDGAPMHLPFPAGAWECEALTVEVLAYGRNDWDWAGLQLEAPTRPRHGLADFRRAVGLLPATSLVLRRRSWIFGRSRWVEHTAHVVLGSPVPDLAPLALATAGAGDDLARAWRLARRLRITVKTSLPGQELATPVNALRARECTTTSWALCYAAMAAAAGLPSGVVRQQGGGQLVAIVNVGGQWNLVPSDPRAVPMDTSAVWPRDVAGQLRVLRKPFSQSPAAFPRARTAWGFLAQYRSARGIE
jgi:superfamily II DNA/RNA helicase